MLFVIHAIDADDAAEKRVAHYPAHFAFLDEAEKHGAKIVMSGPLTQDDEKTPVGSLPVIEAADHAAAERFHHADPFYETNVWKQTSVHTFVRRR